VGAQDGPAGGHLSNNTGRQSPDRVTTDDVRVRALAIWPRLDRKKLSRTCGDPNRVARLVERRTALPPEAILGMLGVPPSADG
jgi:hypothetical protein